MAKKVVASLKSTDPNKGYAKIIRTVRSPKTGAYMFREEMVLVTDVQEALKK